MPGRVVINAHFAFSEITLDATWRLL